VNITSCGTPQKAILRFAFTYFLILFLPGMMQTLIPFGGIVISRYDQLWHVVVRLIAAHAFHLDADIPYFGAEVNNTQSGLILWLCYLVLAIAVALIWLALDRRRPNDERLLQWFRLFLRLSLALILIQYGTFKLIPTQMIAPPPLGVLTQRVGELSPMRLLWVSTGASPLYESLTGFAEVLAGVLLLIPQTVLLGALLSTADMAVVFTLNICYDVPVKLLSLHLLVMAIVLVLPDSSRLANMFFLNRPVERSELVPLFTRARWDHLAQVIVIVAGAYALTSGLIVSYGQYKKFHPPNPPFYGVWSVEQFVINGKTIALFSDTLRWRFVTFQRPHTLSVELMIGSRQGYGMQLDENPKQLILQKQSQNADSEPLRYAQFSFNQPNEETLILDGVLDRQLAHIELRRLPLRTTFHWVFLPPKED
jgi:uncharacterized membrane protein YphA (DoxX/SURF4 family)